MVGATGVRKGAVEWICARGVKKVIAETYHTVQAVARGGALFPAAHEFKVAVPATGQ